jgi:hypothetical protein
MICHPVKEFREFFTFTCDSRDNINVLIHNFLQAFNIYLEK